MKVLLTIWILAALIQEVIPSTLVRLPRQVSNGSSLVHTEYEAKYEQKGKHGNESFSTLSGKQQFVQDNCSENWNAFADKCASLIKDLVASLANAVSSKPGDATNLQLHIKNTFKHFDKTHNCSTCSNQAAKPPLDVDLSPSLNNMTIKPVGPDSNSEGYDNDGSGNSQPIDQFPDELKVSPDCNAEGKEVTLHSRGETPKKSKPSWLIENLDMHPSGDNADDEATNNSRRQVKCAEVSEQPKKCKHPCAAESKPSPSTSEKLQKGQNVSHPSIVTLPPAEPPEGPSVCGDPTLAPGNSPHPKDPGNQSPEVNSPLGFRNTRNDIPPSASQLSPLPANSVSCLNSKDKPQQSTHNDGAPFHPERDQKQQPTAIPLINSNSNLPESSKPKFEDVKASNQIPIYEVIPITPDSRSSKLVTKSPATLSAKGNDLPGLNNKEHNTVQQNQKINPANDISHKSPLKEGEKLIGIVIVTPTPLTEQQAADYGCIGSPAEKDNNNKTPSNGGAPQNPRGGTTGEEPDTAPEKANSPSEVLHTTEPHQQEKLSDASSTASPQETSQEPAKSLITPIIDYLVKIFPLKPGHSDKEKESEATTMSSPKHDSTDQPVTDSNNNQEHPQVETPQPLEEKGCGNQLKDKPAVDPQGENKTGPGSGKSPGEGMTPKPSENGRIPGVTNLPIRPITPAPDAKEQSNGDPILKPTTFQTTSAEPTPRPPAEQPPSQNTHTPGPQDSDETLPEIPITSPEGPGHHDDDDGEEDCCSCESYTEEEIADPKHYKETACKDLEEARKELKKIFDKIKKTLKCGRRAPQRITASCPPRSNQNMKQSIGPL